MINIFKAYRNSKISIFKIYQSYETLRDNYLNKIDHWQEQINKVNALKNENKILSEKIIELEKRIGDPAEVVKKMLGRPIKFVDTSKMSKEAYNAYYREAQAIVNNETFLSEINALIVDLVNSAARDTEDYRQVLNRRFTLCGIELLKHRIEDLAKADDEDKPTEEELLEDL